MMRNRIDTVPSEPEAKAAERQEDSECCHYWLIESPDGPTSRGVCKYCGAEKDFPNSPPRFTLNNKRNIAGSEPADSSDKGV